MASSGELNRNSLNTLKKHLEEGEFANAEDMNVLKKLIDYEVNWRRQQNYALTTEIAQSNKQFDTAKYINNLIGGLKKLHKQKFQLVTQNITFINAIFDIVRKLENLMSYKEYTKYSDHAGCDGECRGLCSSCAFSCTGGSQCSFAQYTGSGGGSYIEEYSSGGCYSNCTSKFSCGTQSSSCPHNCPGYDSRTGYVYAYCLTMANCGTNTSVPLKGDGSLLSTAYSKQLEVVNGVIQSSDPNMQAYLTMAKKNANIADSSAAAQMFKDRAVSGSSLVHGVSGANHNICSYNYSAGGWNSSFYNGGCACKNYSH